MIFQGYIDCTKCGQRLAVCYIDTEQMTMKIYAMENQVKIYDLDENQTHEPKKYTPKSIMCPCRNNLRKYLHHLVGEVTE